MAEIPYLKSITIKGFRGFGAEESLQFAKPNGSLGSGLTLLVGPNNSGKSTIAEAVMSATQQKHKTPAFSEGKRNKDTDSRVEIGLTDGKDTTRIVATIPEGGSETAFSGGDIEPSENKVFVLPSRRMFDPFFGKSRTARDNYVMSEQVLTNTRAGQKSFSGRIFYINSDTARRKAFEEVLGKVLNPLPDWTIEQTDQGHYYLRYTNSGHAHSSDGLGDGILSLFFIVDALYDSEPGSVVFVDEPELSLHPQLQAKVRDLLVEYSADRQIVVSTHAPKFIDWYAIVSGAQIARIVNREGRSRVFQISDATRERISKLLGDMNNPHVLGLDASEVFFLSDRVVLVEGQEDVMFFPKVLADLKLELNANFYGWGVGGAQKMGTVAAILNDLGFEKVAGVLDGNVTDQIPDLEKEFPNYLFVSHPADDVRYKPSKSENTSLLAKDGSTVREEFRKPTSKMLSEVDKYMSG